MKEKKRIGFFDSGVGGLSVLRHAPARIPNADYLYVADAAYAPYGKQDEEQVLKRSLLISDFLVDKNIDALVIACNTATAVAIDVIRERYDLPVIGMEPAIKPAVVSSRNKKIAVLGTENTLRSRRYKKLRTDFAEQHVLFERACHEWVETVEENILPESVIQRVVEKDIQPLINENVDTFILACTHFPFLRDYIEKIIPDSASVIDPAEAVIEQLARKLDVKKETRTDEGDLSLKVYSSIPEQEMARRISSLLNWTVDIYPLK